MPPAIAGQDHVVGVVQVLLPLVPAVADGLAHQPEREHPRDDPGDAEQR